MRLLIAGTLAVAVLAGCEGGASGRHEFLYLRTTHGLVSVDIHSGQVIGLPFEDGCGDEPFCLIPSGGRLVISSLGQTKVYDPTAAGPAETTNVGKGWITVPSQTPGRVWLGILAKGHLGSAHVRGLSAVREVTLDGQTIRSMRPPHGAWPVMATKDALFFQGRDSLRVWSFTADRFVGRIPGPFPADANGELVASCDSPCPRYAVSDLRSGSVVRIPSPDRRHYFEGGYEGAFSPDGSLLALPLVRAAHPAGPAGPLAIVNVAKRSARIVPRAHADSAYGALAWSASGSRLFIATANGRILSYGPGAEEPSVLVKVPLGRDGYIMQMVDLSFGT